ncbi:diaminopimelate epimerase [Nocardioides sp. Kera G14]|uniref:diaminopimelate epimerase n=1 Tax=Nocardioides sp. Kera G14 TaxID=2884264 RepID=UPI001D0FB89D|nr:diaminopimelate epimerase [Nocardioides sp. Kera G14]UDY24136.1 diaminopimelate epimerase [Nocardioides sp. Kera G14]
MAYPFLKGHGTENDFVILPDHDGSIHGALADERVIALCDRRSGIGGDGVLRVIRTESMARIDAEQAALVDHAEWFMDYRNSDGSIAEMCGNGVRVFVLHLIEAGLVPRDQPVPIATRAGIKTVSVIGDELVADLGTPILLDSSAVSIGDWTWSARHVDMGNPHAVAFVDSLDPHGPVGPLLDEPHYDHELYPHGVNIEFVRRVADRHVQMRVHERGSGETQSCGTGACAVMVAAADADRAPRDTPYTVDVPGGRLTITWTSDDRVLLQGPAVIVASGTTTL